MYSLILHSQVPFPDSPVNAERLIAAKKYQVRMELYLFLPPSLLPSTRASVLYVKKKMPELFLFSCVQAWWRQIKTELRFQEMSI